MASNLCFSGEVFSKYSDCFDVCVGLNSATKTNKSIHHDKAAFKALDFYPDEYQINDVGKLSLSPTNQFSANSYFRGNSGITVCFPLDDCFSSNKYWLVEEEKIHFLDHNRQLWIKPIRQFVSYSEFYMKENYAVVCYPKLSDSPLRILNGILCLFSIVALCYLLVQLKLKMNKSGVPTIFPMTLLLGYIFQTSNYLLMCSKPFSIILEKYFFISAFLWINFQTFQLYQKLSPFFRFHSNKYLPFVVSLLPLIFERLCSCQSIDFFRNSCEFLHSDNLYLSVILDTFIVSVVILNTIVLRFVKVELFQRQIQDSGHNHEQFYLYTNLTVIGGAYITVKFITGIIAIEEVHSNWFFIDVLCQVFGVTVLAVYYNKL